MHNSKVVYKPENQPPPGCNCQAGINACPLNGACQTEGVVYEAKITRRDNQKSEFYTGVTAGTFKRRYYGHRYDFNHRKQRSSTCLSKYVWDLQDQGISYDIDWQIIARGRGFNPTTRSCQACLKEKYFIMFRPEGATLNDTCRHRKTIFWKYLNNNNFLFGIELFINWVCSFMCNCWRVWDITHTKQICTIYLNE